MKLISFRLSGRFGHFLRAEGGASAASYPVPPRTVILGIIGAVLGLPKDQPQVVLEPAHIAISGKLPQTHWHKAKFRQDSIEHLSYCVNKNQKGRKQVAIEMPKLIAQEWLFNPNYKVWVSIPEPYFIDLEQRLIERRWYFPPSLGLSEMMAELAYLKSEHATPLPMGAYPINTLFLQECATLDIDNIFRYELVLHSFRMPRAVTPERVFSHRDYFMERDARPVPVETDQAFKTSDEILMFL